MPNPARTSVAAGAQEFLLGAGRDFGFKDWALFGGLVKGLGFVLGSVGPEASALAPCTTQPEQDFQEHSKGRLRSAWAQWLSLGICIFRQAVLGASDGTW